MKDLRLNWENPFLFYDPDRDGLSEMAIRLSIRRSPIRRLRPTDSRSNRLPAGPVGIDRRRSGQRQCAGQRFRFRLYARLYGRRVRLYGSGARVASMRGLPEADRFFIDPRFRELTELIYADHKNAWNLIYRRGRVGSRPTWCSTGRRLRPLGTGRVLLSDGPRSKWVPVKGGVDNHPQSDWAGDRGECGIWTIPAEDGCMSAVSTGVSTCTARRGVLAHRPNGPLFPGIRPVVQNKAPKSFATVKYTDTDDNGFLDCIEYDLDGDRVFETKIELKALGVDDRCELIDVSISNTAISPVYIKRCPARCGRMRSLPERRPNVSD